MNTNSTLLISKCVGKSSNKLISIQKNTNLIHNLMTSSVKVALVPEPVWASFMTSSSGGVKNGTCSRTCLDKIDDVVLINTIKFVRSRQPGIISLMSYSLLWFVKINTELLRGVFTTQRFDTPV